MKIRLSKWIIALVILFVGINLILKGAQIQTSLLFKGWWTLPVIILGLISIKEEGFEIKGIGLTVLGVWFLANQRGWIPKWFNSSFFVGGALILFSLIYLLKPGGRTKTSYRLHSKEDEEDTPSYTAIFGGQEIRNRGTNLGDSTLFSLFGGLSVDFSDSIIQRDIIIDVTAIFGGVTITLPPNVTVISKATPFFGGVDNKSKKTKGSNTLVVTVRSLVAFGGVEIEQ